MQYTCLVGCRLPSLDGYVAVCLVLTIDVYGPFVKPENKQRKEREREREREPDEYFNLKSKSLLRKVKRKCLKDVDSVFSPLPTYMPPPKLFY